MFVIEKESQGIINKDNNRRSILDDKAQTLNDDSNKDHDLLKDADIEYRKFENEFIPRKLCNSKIDNKDDINSISAINMRKDKAFKNVFRAPKKSITWVYSKHTARSLKLNQNQKGRILQILS